MHNQHSVGVDDEDNPTGAKEEEMMAVLLLLQVGEEKDHNQSGKLKK